MWCGGMVLTVIFIAEVLAITACMRSNRTLYIRQELAVLSFLIMLCKMLVINEQLGKHSNKNAKQTDRKCSAHKTELSKSNKITYCLRADVFLLNFLGAR